MDAVGLALNVCIKWVCDPISRQLRYLIDLKKNYERLKRKVDRLHAWVQDVKREISEKKATAACQRWLKEAKEIQNEWEEIEKEYQRNRRCLERWCHNISNSRLKLGKCIVALIKKIEEIDNSVFQLVIDEPPPIMTMPTPRVLDGNTSVDQTLQQLLASVKKPSVNRIGLWGMAGVGKTRIMKLLNNHPEIGGMFKPVLWVTVSKEWTYRKVLEDLAGRLGLNIQESDDLLKRRVFMELRATKFLLLLDDVWNMIDLEEVGIPFLDEEKIGFKVVLSTRYRSVCNDMRTDEEINVTALSEEEAWSLFRSEVGEEVVDDLRIKEIAKKVVMECDGLPLAIIVVAGALRKEANVHVWRNALKELSLAGKIKDTESRVYQRLRYSYDRLDDNSKECFLYCALFPEDWEIPKTELVRYWINEGLIYGWSNLDQGEDKGFSKLKELIDASLLEERRPYCIKHVKMHDVMRDLALRILSAQGEVLVKASVKLSELPKLEDWEKAIRISLMRNDLETLPRILPSCGRLITLLLQENYQLQEIPQDFFEHMPALKVLNLSSTGIESLPPSICSLSNLQGLYLNNCLRLKVIPRQVRGLTKLETFQMGGSNRVHYLPVEIGDLTSLKHLEVTCGPTEEEELQEINMFPRLSNLSNLERLGIVGKTRNFAAWWDRCSEGVSKDISVLSNLTHLSITFSKIEHFEHFVQQGLSSWNKLTNFHLHIGRLDVALEFVIANTERLGLDNSFIDEDKARRLMIYNDPMWKTMLGEALTRVDAFAVGASIILQSLSEFGCEHMKELEICFIIGCKYLETILCIDDDRDNGKQNGDLLPNLQKLYLHRLPNLKSILEKPSPSSPPLRRRCFPRLTFLELHFCHTLKWVLSRCLIPHLSNLEQLFVHSCDEVHDIIGMDEEEGGEEIIPEIQTLLPRLKKLSVRKLPKLRCICSNKEHPTAGGWQSLEEISIEDCTNLKSLPHGFIIAPNLQKIDCQASWLETLGWEDDALKQHFFSKVCKH